MMIDWLTGLEALLLESGRMKLRLLLAAVMMLAACSHAGSTAGSRATPATAATNAVDFPLYDGSSVISTRTWRQTVSSAAAAEQQSVYSEGAGTYAGHEVVAQSSSSMAQIQAWLAALDTKPPANYDVAVSGSTLDEARRRAQTLGLDFGTFERNVNGKRYGVVVIVVDPQQLDAKAGSILSLIGEYQRLPQVLRDPIDAQAKARTGFTVSEALDPNTPVGAALGALTELRNSGERGIVLLDAAKQ